MRSTVKRRLNVARTLARSSVGIRAIAAVASFTLSTMNPETPSSTISETEPHLNDDGRAACHCFNEHQPERLRPVDRKEQGGGIAQKFRLFVFGDLADIFDIGMSLHQRADCLLPIG